MLLIPTFGTYLLVSGSLTELLSACLKPLFSPHLFMHLSKCFPFFLIPIFFLLLFLSFLLYSLNFRLICEPSYLVRCKIRLKFVFREITFPDSKHFLPYVKRNMESLYLLAILIRVVALKVLQDILSAVLFCLVFKLLFDSIYVTLHDLLLISIFKLRLPELIHIIHY